MIWVNWMMDGATATLIWRKHSQNFRGHSGLPCAAGAEAIWPTHERLMSRGHKFTISSWPNLVVQRKLSLLLIRITSFGRGHKPLSHRIPRILLRFVFRIVCRHAGLILLLLPLSLLVFFFLLSDFFLAFFELVVRLCQGGVLLRNKGLVESPVSLRFTLNHAS